MPADQTGKLHPEVQQLADYLGNLVALLRRNGSQSADFWAGRLETCRQSILRSDAYGLQMFMASFGGMGSLNDFYLNQGNGEFDKLLGEAWQLGQRLEREEQSR